MKPLFSRLAVASLVGMFVLTGAGCTTDKVPTSTSTPSVEDIANASPVATPTAMTTHSEEGELQAGTPSASSPTFSSSTASVAPTATIPNITPTKPYMDGKPDTTGYSVGQTVDKEEFFAKTVAAQKQLSSMKVTASAPQYGTETTVYDFTGNTPRSLTTISTQGVAQEVYQAGDKIYYKKGGKWLPAKPSGAASLPYIAGGLIPDTKAFQKVIYRGDSQFEATVVNSQTKKTAQVFFTVDPKFNITELSMSLMKMTIKQSDFNKKVTLPKVA